MTERDAQSIDVLSTDAVHGNDWRSLEVGEFGLWKPSQMITVILPCYMGQTELELTFAGLADQTYPTTLFEAVVVDDGSDPPIILPTGVPFAATLIAQERDGFGLARARNLGAERAAGDILLFLDCDMIPESQLLEAHARWHHLNDQVVTIGFRHHADFDGVTAEQIQNLGGPGGSVAGRRFTSPQWVEFHMTRTRNLTSDDTDLFRVASGGNLGVRREFFNQVGGCDSSFRQWGAEDIEFGYRAFNQGAVLVPERQAVAWHQGVGAGPDPAEEASLVEQRNRLSHLIAEPTFRRSTPGRSFQVPMLTVAVNTAEQTFDEAATQIEGVLASNFHDLVVVLAMPQNHPERVNLDRQYGSDPRVVVDDDPMVAVPNASLRLEVPPRVLLHPTDISSLMRGLKGHGVVRVDLDRHGELRMATTRALSRATRLGAANPWVLAGELFDSRTMKIEALKVTVPTSKTPAPSRPSINPPVWVLAGKVFRKFIAVRSLADVTTALSWSWRGIHNVVHRGRRSARQRRVDRRAARSSRSSRSSRSGLQVPGWVQVSGSTEHLPGAQTWRGQGAGVELVAAAPDAQSGRFDSSSGAVPIVRLGEPSGIPLVSPVDHRRYNPAGFRPVVGDAQVVPAPDLPWPEDRIRAGRSALAVRIERCDEPSAAIRLLEFVAAGVPVVLGDPSGSEVWLGATLAAAVNATDPDQLANPTERERASVAVRRAALALHTLPARLRQLRRAADLPVLPPPSVSVVVATNRPAMVDRIIDAVGMQDHPEVELVLALHGDGFVNQDPTGPAGLPLTVLRFAASMVFGNVLFEACRAASGEWVAKMDDDDWYGIEHLSDLLLAADYSGAELVGKGSEFVYLEEDDITIRRDLGNSEVESRTLAGGTLMVQAEALRGTHGWRRLPRGVDVALIDDVVAAGGRVWRTHPFGYLLRRTAGKHTWQVGDRYFLRHADQQWDGQAFEVAGVVGV